MREVEIWLFRHGETEWSRSGAHTGRTDIELTSGGRSMGERLGRWLNGRPFAMVLASPLRRAAETCRLAGYGAQCQIDPDLMEWDYGAYEGRRTAEIREERPEWSLWVDGVPGGEKIDDVVKRARRVIARAEAAAGPVALFAHGHLLRVLTATWLELPPSEAQRFTLDTGSVSVLGHEREVRALRMWNRAIE